MKMPRLFLTIFVTAGLFFLPSCSSGSGQADCESIQQEVTAQGKKMNALIAEGVDVVSTDRQKAK
jgi:hypothetical protein